MNDWLFVFGDESTHQCHEMTIVTGVLCQYLTQAETEAYEEKK